MVKKTKLAGTYQGPEPNGATGSAQVYGEAESEHRVQGDVSASWANTFGGVRGSGKRRAAIVAAFLSLFASAPQCQESTIIEKGTAYDKVSGADYYWNIFQNGAVQLIGQEVPSGDYFKISLSTSGTMISSYRASTWSYDVASDACRSTRGDVLRGDRCIHPVVSHFFMEHTFKPKHPIEERIKGGNQ